MTPTIDSFVWGATAMGCGSAGLFFLRSWWRTRDRLLLVFALAFWVLALNWTVLTLIPMHTAEATSYVYVIRLFAFLLLLVGIIDKNRPR